jgi:hypothetical protein
MATTTENNVQLTVSIDQETRRLFAKHGGQRGIGRLLKALIRKHDVAEIYGEAMVVRRLDRIDARLVELLERQGSMGTHSAGTTL